MKNIKNRLHIVIILATLNLIVINLAAQSGWQQVYTGSDNVRDMSFVAGSNQAWETGWVLTTSSNLVKTTDGGDSWTLITQTEAAAVNGVCFVDENIGYMSSANGKIIKSTDGGLTWATVYDNSADWFGQLAFKDSLNGVVSGIPVKYTNDGGVTWTSGSYSTNYDRIDYGAGDTYFSAGFLAGKAGKSIDNGASWVDVLSPGQILVTIEFLDDTYGLTGGSSFTVEYTTDGGSTWHEEILSGGTGDLLSSGYFDKDTIYVAGSNGEVYKSINGGTDWNLDTITTTTNHHRAMFVTPTNVVYIAGDPMQVWRKIGPTPLVVDFEADDTNICSGSTVNFTDLSFGDNISTWTWAFEGGTPSSSSDQNPSVVYNSGGIYNVSLTVTDDNGSKTKIELDMISVLEVPAKPDTPSGEASVCTDSYQNYTTTEVLYAEEYEWELVPASAGTLEENGNEASLAVADDWTGDFTLSVRVSNMCGTGEWSDNFEGTVYQSPDEFTILGGGSYCLDGEGVEITLDGSQTGVDYELLLDEVPTGNIVAGTGSDISFGLITDAGLYTAEGSNGVCFLPMGNETEVIILNPPAAPEIPVGPVSICTETSSDYSSIGNEDADSYTWELSPEEAGTLTTNGLEATINWNSEFNGTAVLSLYGINDCGDGTSSEALEISVGAPNPEINGEEMACDWSDEFYQVVENEGSTYTWEVTGGTITEGQGTYMITVAWNGEGNGTISVEEETVDGCAGSSDQFDVVIDDCTAIDENAAGNLNIYPNPASHLLNVSFISIENNETKLNIYNSAGQQVISKIIQNSDRAQTQQINISNLNQGIYLLEINSEGKKIATKRFIKN